MCSYLHTYRSHVISDTASKNVDLKSNITPVLGEEHFSLKI
jgi:hypothetical protein